MRLWLIRLLSSSISIQYKRNGEEKRLPWPSAWRTNKLISRQSSREVRGVEMISNQISESIEWLVVIQTRFPVNRDANQCIPGRIHLTPPPPPSRRGNYWKSSSSSSRRRRSLDLFRRFRHSLSSSAQLRSWVIKQFEELLEGVGRRLIAHFMGRTREGIMTEELQRRRIRGVEAGA